MERIVKRTRHGLVVPKNRQLALERLAAYEDTDLLPEEIPHWISASKPPQKDDRYFCYDSLHEWKFVAAYRKGVWGVDSNMAGSLLLHVTHWMPLPQAPQKEGGRL